MLFVHFTPKNNVSDIKRNGIRPGKRRVVYLFPLVHGEKRLINQWDAPLWWQRGSAAHDRPSAKIIVRLPNSAQISLGDWVHSMGVKSKEDLLLFSVSEIGRVLAGMFRNPYSNAAVPRGGRATDRALLIEFAEWCKKARRYYADASSVRKLLTFWRKNRRWERDEDIEPQSHGIDLWGSEVVYPGRIPPHWIVRILDNTNTDVPSRAYTRHARNRRPDWV